MLGILAWLASSGVMAFALMYLDETSYAGSLLVTFLGLILGGEVNDWSNRRWPNAWWNV